MNLINRFIKNLNPYKVASHAIWEGNADERKGILKLDWNEATIPPSPKVKQELLKVINDEMLFAYYPSTHNAKLLSALSKYSNVGEEQIQYFASSDAAHQYLVKLLLKEGENVLILGPTYDNFRLTCEAQGAAVEYFNYDRNFELDLEGLNNSIKCLQPKLVYLCNPNNPTGNSLSLEFIKELVLNFSDTMFLIDEAYYEFNKVTASSLVGEFKNVCISRTFSKAFGLAGFRAGYLIANPEIIELINRYRNPKNFTSLTQVAVLAALSDVEYTNQYINEVIETREYFAQKLIQILPFLKVFPSNGNFVLIRFTDSSQRDFVYQELAKKDIYVRNLSHHEYVLDCIRVTIGNKAQMDRVLTSIQEILA